MKKEEKRNLMILIIVAIVIIAILVGVGKRKNSQNVETENKIGSEGVQTDEENVRVLEDGIKLNTSEELNKDKEIDGIQITNIQLTEQDGQTILLADVTNSTEAETDVIGINIIVLDKEGNEIGTIPGAVSPLKPGETKQLNTGITENYANAYNFRVEKQ